MGVNADLSKETKLKKTKTNNCLEVQTMNDGLEKSKKKPDPKQLFGQLWYQNELTVCFAKTGAGKTLLAYQIANALASGCNTFPNCNDDLKNENKKGIKVLYVDAELSWKQIEMRYTNDKDKSLYNFSNNFFRANPTKSKLPKGRKYGEWLCEAIEDKIKVIQPEAVIIDNLSVLRSGTEKSEEAIELMNYLNGLKNIHNISMLVLGHTPKIPSFIPMDYDQLEGSKKIANLLDGCFGIGFDPEDSTGRYIIELKQRNRQFKFWKTNVAYCNIDKTLGFLKYVLDDFRAESDILVGVEGNDERTIKNLLKLKETHPEWGAKRFEAFCNWKKDKILKIFKENGVGVGNEESDNTDNADKTDKTDKTDNADKNGTQNQLKLSEASATSDISEPTTITKAS